MTNAPSLARHTLNKRIELFRHEDGELGVLCEKCDRVNLAGQPWCCVWAKGMVFSYIFGRIKPSSYVLKEVA